MNILSLFDGTSAGRLAAQRAGLPINKYYASEIDKYAIAVSKKNYPDIIHLGNVEDYQEWDIDFGKIDLLLGGSPCQGFSIAGKQLNFEDPRSKLFFEYVEILKKIREKNPNVLFLLENVRMKKEFQNIISEHLGVEPIEINSNLVSAQNRKRLYWTNIPNIKQPEDKGIMLKDIVHEKADIDFAVSETWCKWFKRKAQYYIDKSYVAVSPEKAITMTARQIMSWNGNFIYECLEEYIVPFDKTLKILEKEVEKGKVGYFKTDSQGNRIYYIHDKAVTLCGQAGGRGAKTGLYLFGCITPDRVNKRQNGQRFNEGQKFYTLTAQDKHGVLVEGYIRKLTPIECERLQTLPDDYTNAEIDAKPISDSQRYKMLGNGWTVGVIAHILKGIKTENEQI
ncbi:DNA (cytosine-5-)-methyltransferase [Criibacterium bergeronii]|uniref:DNA (cytosine-5-)-methyltransferase n=1 Tax=Criibacterium bergeronii TaxID=1871336 RepID=A0A371IJS6_9FIRM|nr:DNA (cytosine-5-)-methyltransferase [Criibacterium bergeronii]RDY20735.1 DNA (cytosine-5-)-methyltransferase [Criibacterium bergeronii]